MFALLTHIHILLLFLTNAKIPSLLGRMEDLDVGWGDAQTTRVVLHGTLDSPQPWLPFQATAVTCSHGGQGHLPWTSPNLKRHRLISGGYTLSILLPGCSGSNTQGCPCASTLILGYWTLTGCVSPSDSWTSARLTFPPLFSGPGSLFPEPQLVA